MLSKSDKPFEVGELERLILRARRHYERAGYSRLWIDQRMRSLTARHELTSEWYRRGVGTSEEFRALTNELFLAAFGFDVEHYRRYKGLFRTRQNLRDHMTDLELSLVSLAETTTLELHRRRRSSGFDALLLDARDAGRIIAATRRAIEEQSGAAVVSASNHLPPPPRPAPLPPTNLAA